MAPLLPPGQPVWDVHAHLGEDADGSQLAAADLIADAASHGVERTFVFPFRQDGLRRLPRAKRRDAGRGGDLGAAC